MNLDKRGKLALLKICRKRRIDMKVKRVVELRSGEKIALTRDAYKSEMIERLSDAKL